MKIVVGLGNPGLDYQFTRHNLGFMVMDAVAENHSLSFAQRKFKSLIASGSIAGQKVVLVKPQTFMNLSGEAVGPLVRFYKRPLEDLVVVYDDIDILFGNIRLRPDGGSGGHKGIQSIIENLGTDAVPRVRIGIRGNMPIRDLSAYVLKPFTSDEDTELDRIILKACEAVEAVLKNHFEGAMNEFN